MSRPARTDRPHPRTLSFSGDGWRLLTELARRLSERQGPLTRSQLLEQLVRQRAKKEGVE